MRAFRRGCPGEATGSDAGEDVAAVIAALRVEGTSGVEFLSRVREVHPLAKRILLIDPMDMETREVLPRAMALGRIDDYEFKPGPPPNEHFHQAVTDLLEEWTGPYRSEIHALVRVVGERWSRRVHEAMALFDRYGVPRSFYAVDSEGGRALLEQVGKSVERLPVIVLHDGQALVDPTNREVADAFVGADVSPERQTCDVVVIGGGPAGLAAAVYGASEGLDTMVVEREAIGGQAGASSLLLAHMFLEAKTTKLIDSLEIAAVKFLNSVVERLQEVETRRRIRHRAAAQHTASLTRAPLES